MDYDIHISTDIDINILKILKCINEQNLNIGRKGIAEMLTKYNIFLGEQEVRNYLLELQNKGLVEIRRGRGGTIITPKGIDYLRNL